MSIKTKNKGNNLPPVRLYDKETINKMRERLCEAQVRLLSWAQAKGVLSEKNKLVHKILWEGCHGWGNVHDAIVITQYEKVYGEYKK